jgi:hypothetical protein
MLESAPDDAGTHHPQAVLITGVYGAGKSSVGAEMADILEGRGSRFALIDLDFLAWGYPGSDDAGAEHRMMLRNLTPVLANYREAGVRSFVLAGFIEDRAELESLTEALRMPLRVVRLIVPWPEIERRLRSDVTSGRLNDLREAAGQIEAATDVGIEDLALSNDRPVRHVAAEILDWLGWG